MFTFQKFALKVSTTTLIVFLLPLSINAQSLVFNGSSDYVDCGNDASLQITGTITIEAWINTTGPDGSYAAIVSKLVHTASQEGYELGIYPDRRIFFSLGRDWSDWQQCTSSNSVPSGTNTYVKGTYDGTNLRVYIGTSLEGTIGYLNGIVDSGTSLNIGRRYNTSGTYFKGSIDEVRISDGSGLVAYYPMNEGGGSTLYDNSSNSNTGTIYGATWSEQSLSVELSLFSAQIENRSVVLKWITESEVDNLGFILERSENNSSWGTIASYQTHDALKGQCNTSNRTEYTFLDNTVEPGREYWYCLSDVSTKGEVTRLTPLSIKLDALPETTTMENAYPNPFNPETYIAYHLAEAAQVKIMVFDLLGRSVKELHSGRQSAGTYHVYWSGVDQNGREVSSGTYIICMETENTIQIQKVVFTK